jgi:hypothetical protein
MRGTRRWKLGKSGKRKTLNTDMEKDRNVCLFFTRLHKGKCLIGAKDDNKGSLANLFDE